MVEDKNYRYQNKLNRMSDAKIMVILILFHSGVFRCFKYYYKEYVCKHLTHLFPKRVSYNRFVEQEKEILLQLTVFVKEVLLEACTGISAYWFIRLLKCLRRMENIPWDCSSDLNCIWLSTIRMEFSISCSHWEMWMATISLLICYQR